MWKNGTNAGTVMKSKIMQNHAKSCKIMPNHAKSCKIMQNHGTTHTSTVAPVLESHGKSWKVTERSVRKIQQKIQQK